MAWCPRCGGEFVEGIKFCKKCDADLVDSIEGGKKEKNGELQLKKPQAIEKEIFLINTNNLVELAYTTSLLDEEGVSYRTIEKDI